MRVHIATDHAGLELSAALIDSLSAKGYEMVDHGPTSYDAEDDYPGFCIAAAQAVVQDQAAGVDALGIVLGGSGNGEQMAANKVKGIRAALCYNTELAQLAREHNNAQVISIGGRFNTIDEAKEMVKVFLETPFSGAERHQRRLDMVTDYENTGELPPQE